MSLSSYVFIETQVFYTNNWDLKRTAFRELVIRAKQGRVVVIQTTVTTGEVKRHIKDKVKESAKAINDFKKDVKILANSAEPTVSARATHIDERRVTEELVKSFEKYLADCDAEIIDVSDVDPEVVFDKYFSLAPPFEGKKEKRHEFPDAFAIEALANFATSNQLTLCVVSGDKGFSAACSGRGMKCFATVEEYLDFETKLHAESLPEHILECFDSQVDKIKDAIESEFKDGTFVLEDVDGDVDSVDVDDVELDDPLIISTGDGTATLEVQAKISFSAKLSYDDPDATVYDKEDDKTYVFNTIEERVSDDIDVPVEIEITFDLRDEAWCDFQISRFNNRQEVRVHSSY